MIASKSILVIGGGAAGYFTAINVAANYPDAKVIILEKNSKTLQKVKVSGGGRCNVTNRCFDVHQLAKNYPRGAKELLQAFHQFSVSDTIAWFKKQAVNLIAEEDNRMFPESNNSQSIIDCFERQVNAMGVKVYLNCEVLQIIKHENQFSIQLKSGKELYASHVVVTCGGFNHMGAYQFLSSFNINIIPPIPSLFTFNLANKSITKLMGLSVSNAHVKINQTNFQYKGPLLITHWGFSGPAVIKLSAFAAVELAAMNYHFDLIVNWNSNYEEDQLKKLLIQLKNNSAKVWGNIYQELNIPKRLLEFLLTTTQILEHKKLAETNNKVIDLFCQLFCHQMFEIKGKTTFKEEFVTCGGVDLKEVNFKTMACKKVPGLYFAGEVLNIDGITGGFNFQAAWTTAYIAAQLKT
jgi:predicted Rossmann fold flavoprotein